MHKTHSPLQTTIVVPTGDTLERREAEVCTEPHPEAYYILCTMKTEQENTKIKKKQICIDLPGKLNDRQAW